MELKVGQQFEVVEVLTDGDYIGLFKVGGYTIHTLTHTDGFGNTLTNGPIRHIEPCVPMYARELRRVGRLTVTAIHDCESKIK